MTRASGDVGVGECQGSPNCSANPVPYRAADDPVALRGGHHTHRLQGCSCRLHAGKILCLANIVMILKIPDVGVSKSPRRPIMALISRFGELPAREKTAAAVAAHSWLLPVAW